MRVARIDGQFVINPTFEQLEKADMDLMVAATYENIMICLLYTSFALLKG